METEIHELPVDGLVVLSEIPVRISVGDILLASLLRQKARSETSHRGTPLPSSRLSLSLPLPSRTLPLMGVHSHSVSLSAAPIANCHFSDSLFCENRLHSDSNEASFTPCHASYTPLGTHRQFRRFRRVGIKGDDSSDSSIDT